jgi:phospholipid-binding lipoprotein MlaA
MKLRSFAGRGWCAALVLVLLQGCASTPQLAAPAKPDIDPWENWNRKVFAFNDDLDHAVVKPTATAYRQFVPQFVRSGVGNFFGNFTDAWSAVNNLLQGKGERGFSDIMRVGTNTVLGVFGLFDVATEAGIERTREDFGQTLGVWGVPPGPYVVWPVFGPSSVRESLALPLDLSVTPAFSINETAPLFGVAILQLVHVRANLLGASSLLDDVALDRYSFLRDAYLQRRRYLVYDGDPPEPPPEPDDADPATEPEPKPDESNGNSRAGG